jgi:hypothetical protein
VDRLVIRPNGPIAGTVRAGGAKNSALKLMAACLLAEGRHELHNVPNIVDVQIMADMLGALGVGVGRQGDILVVDVPPADRLSPEAPYELVDKMRASIVVLGPLLARCGYARLSMPGVTTSDLDRSTSTSTVWPTWGRALSPAMASSKGRSTPARRVPDSSGAGSSSTTRATPPPTT